MENNEFIELYNEFKQEQDKDFHFQILSEMIDIKEIRANKITLCAQNEFSCDNFKARYLASLQSKVMQKKENTLLEVILDRKKANKKNIAKKEPANTRSSQTSHIQELPFTGISRSADNIQTKLSFQNYIEGDHNRWAIAVGRALSKELNDSYNPFLIWGNIGLGKTHLLHAIGNTCKERYRKVLYVNSVQFLNGFVHAIRMKRQESFKQKYRNVDVLLIDDIHDLTGKNKTQDELYSLFEHFQKEGKQLVFSCDRPPNELKEFHERLSSRLKSGTNVHIGIPCYEVRLAILEHKAKGLGLQLSASVLEFLAQNICDNVRDLNAALNKIHSFTKILGQAINVQMLEQELQEFLSHKQKPLLIRDIQTHVARHYRLELSDILGKRRNANIALARQVAMFLSRELTPFSSTELGTEFHRDHATVLAGVRKIEKRQKNDQNFAVELDSLKRELQINE